MLQIHTLEVTPFAQNARLVHDAETSTVCIVDPGGEIPRIISVLEELDPKSVQVLLTHAHIDHGGGVANCLEALTEKFGQKPPLAAHSEGMVRGSIAQQAAVFGLPQAEYRNVPEPDLVLDEGDTYTIGGYGGAVYWTPGHAPDHLSIYFEKAKVELHQNGVEHVDAPILIVGDALFAGSIGRTDLPGGSHPTLLQSIKEKLLPLPEDTVVLSGHGPNTTIGREKESNPFLR